MRELQIVICSHFVSCGNLTNKKGVFIMNRIKELRQEKGLTLRQLSEKTGIRDNTISQYETGKRYPKEINLLKLADFFGVSSTYLMGENNIKNIDDFLNILQKFINNPKKYKNGKLDVSEYNFNNAQEFLEAVEKQFDFLEYKNFNLLYSEIPLKRADLPDINDVLNKIDVRKIKEVNNGTREVFRLYVDYVMGNEEATEKIRKIEKIINSPGMP